MSITDGLPDGTGDEPASDEHVGDDAASVDHVAADRGGEHDGRTEDGRAHDPGPSPGTAGTDRARPDTEDPQDTEDPEDPTGRTRAPWVNRLLRSAAWAGVALLWTAGVAGGGYWYGHRQAADSMVVPAPVVDVQVVAAQPTADATDPDDAPPPIAPDVVGLPLERAQAAMADAEVDPGRLQVDDTPQVGEPGLVVTQDPPGGEEVDGPVQLTVSAPATVPEVVGDEEAAATQRLSALGARVRRVGVYQPDAEVGTVLTVDPPAGEPLAEEAVLEVAVGPDGVLVTDLRAQERDCRTDDSDIVVARSTYDVVVRCSVWPERQYVQSYLLADGVAQITATVGLVDTSDARARARFVLRTEDGTLDSAEVGIGEHAQLTGPLGDAVRVELVVESLEPPDADWDDVDAVWADVRITGAPAAIDELVGRDQ